MEQEPQPILTITALARQAGAHVNSAENYVRAGELRPARASNGVRLFSTDDVTKLRALVAAGRARRGRKAQP